MQMNKITLLIGDNQSVFRFGLKTLLCNKPEIEIIGEAADGESLVELAVNLKPDIVLTDLKMPLLDGLAATKVLLQSMPNCRIIALSSSVKDAVILQILEAGVMGYLVKSAEADEINEAIQTVYKRKPYFCKEIMPRLNDIISRNYSNAKSNFKEAFTEREIDIIRLICMEYTSKEIADKLYLSKRTVEGHRTKIMTKIGAKSIARVITYAIEYNIYSATT